MKNKKHTYWNIFPSNSHRTVPIYRDNAKRNQKPKVAKMRQGGRFRFFYCSFANFFKKKMVMTRKELEHIDIFLFSLNEAAQLLRVSRKKLTEFIQSGELDVVRIDERRTQIAYEDIRRFINKHKYRFGNETN